MWLINKQTNKKMCNFRVMYSLCILVPLSEKETKHSRPQSRLALSRRLLRGLRALGTRMETKRQNLGYSCNTNSDNSRMRSGPSCLFIWIFSFQGVFVLCSSITEKSISTLSHACPPPLRKRLSLNSWAQQHFVRICVFFKTPHVQYFFPTWWDYDFWVTLQFGN